MTFGSFFSFLSPLLSSFGQKMDRIKEEREMGGKDRKKRTKGRTDEKTDRQNQRHTQLYMYIVEIIQCLVNQRRRTNKHPLPYFLTEIITYQDQGNIIILHKITIALNVMSTLLKSVPMALVFNACRKHETIVSIQNNQCFTQIT